MKFSKRVVCLMAVAILALTLAASASQKTKKIGITLFTDVKVASVTLKPGEYQLVVEDGSVTFLRDGREVAKAAVETKTNSTKFDGTELVTDSGALKEIDLGGSTNRLMLK